LSVTTSDAPHPNLRSFLFLAFSGMFFGIFLSLHIIGTSVAAFGELAFNQGLELLRKVYQHPAFEVCLAASFVLHMIAGSILHWRRDKFGFAPSPPAQWYVRLQRLSGSVIGFIILLHVSGTRLPVLLGKHRPEDFAHLHVLFRTAPVFVFAYCGIYAGCAIVHLLLGIPQVFERVRALPSGSYHKIASHWLFWFLVVATTSSVFAGMYALYDLTPANKADLEYWTPIVQANVPAMLRST